MKRNFIAGSLIAVIALAGLFMVGEVSLKESSKLVSQSSMLAQVWNNTNSEPVIGWAWSSNTGWLSFSSANAGAGGSIPYGVRVSTTSYATRGDFRGQAWSSNVGWVYFDPDRVVGCPSDSGGGAPPPINGCNATVDLNTGQVTGWARIISSTAPENGGGWLQLSGQTIQQLHV